jgi:hypothetical protein
MIGNVQICSIVTEVVSRGGIGCSGKSGLKVGGEEKHRLEVAVQIEKAEGVG